MVTIAERLTGIVHQARTDLLAIAESRAAEKPYPDKWSIKEVLGHMIDSAANNHQRIVRMQEAVDIGVFRYAQQHWVDVQGYHAEPWQDLVEFWYQYNAHLAHMIRRIDPASLEHVCDVGYAKPATLRFVIEDYVRHVEHHLNQMLSGADPRGREQWVRRDPGKSL